jgi:hypothetical protein
MAFVDGESVDKVVAVDGSHDDGGNFLTAYTGVRWISNVVGIDFERGGRLVDERGQGKGTIIDGLTQMLDSGVT